MSVKLGSLFFEHKNHNSRDQFKVRESVNLKIIFKYLSP